MSNINPSVGDKGMPTAIYGMTALEVRMLKCIREYRRLNNKVVRDVNECNAVHQEADDLLTRQPELDDRTERFDAPHRVEHREFVHNTFFRPNPFKR